MAFEIFGGLVGAIGAYVGLGCAYRGISIPGEFVVWGFFVPYGNCRRSTSPDEASSGRDVDAGKRCRRRGRCCCICYI
ncbi:MAG: hypothetical protein DDT27_01189 [Dehalococcoidia bacterium]|nr:hypothetical protein [Chloroflexota bacterium]MBT9162630.1 hypothetical protein [Chloroflexota bacterium]